ncbi:MarR family transcriptional regulator [Actinacidiphila guanduensis]|uniref:DNA-binding transcriptional regulator, MarR family n=1 Tax=Actinacidiphila guanduensis TaxID=310781 RepID=A0A1H0BTM4_9ACTN|nr:MarR family transcriptional regulator [Actinacidiphila guanduensis]SDN48931.1 DNA-binding transcriptional regulator, MarR family [Actinacidiphila guanduensis]
MNSEADPVGGKDPAAQAWAGMQRFLAGEDRRHALRVQLDLGAGKAELLVRLAEAPMTLRDIAQVFEVDPSAATVTVDRLERRGFVRRGPHPEDNRRKLVHLTDAGRQAAATAHRILTDPPPALTALDAADIAALTRIFATLNGEPPPAGSGQ